MHETSNCQLLVRAQIQAEREIILPFSFSFLRGGEALRFFATHGALPNVIP